MLIGHVLLPQANFFIFMQFSVKIMPNNRLTLMDPPLIYDIYRTERFFMNFELMSCPLFHLNTTQYVSKCNLNGRSTSKSLYLQRHFSGFHITQADRVVPSNELSICKEQSKIFSVQGTATLQLSACQQL